MDKKETITLGIFVFFLLATVILLFFAVPREGIIGKAVTETDKDKVISSQAITNELGCADSDSGRNYFEQGSVNYCNSDNNCFTQKDSCSGKKLSEWYCENNEARYEEHECEDVCEEGVCVTIAKKFVY